MVRMNLLTLLIIVAVLFVGGGAVLVRLGVLPNIFSKPLPPSNEQASSDEDQQRVAIASAFPGRIVFDSNRTGTFGIFSIKPDGSDLQTVVDSDRQEMYPDPSPDGNWIVYSKADSTERRAKSSIWTCKADGSEQRLVAKDGTFPTFSSDGKHIYFERSRAKVMMVAFDGSGEKEIFPAGVDFGNYQIVKPRVSPDGSSVAFISSKNGRWNTWFATLADGSFSHLDEGCEPAWFSNSEEIAWIKTKNTRERSGLYRYQIASKAVTELQDGLPPRGHEYFPSLVANDSFLLYSSCREGEHSHLTANYQIFVKQLPDGKPVRITFDNHTNRWPKLLAK